jgi:hypothetical protein
VPFFIDLMRHQIIDLKEAFFYKAYGDQPSLVFSHNDRIKNMELDL